MRVLITGSAGFIGRHMTARWAEKYPGDVIVGCDVKNGWDCRDLFRTDAHFDVVIHCAATVGGREGIDYNSAFLGADNLSIDGSMFSWALRARPGRVVFFSSAASYPVRLQSRPVASREEHLDFEIVGAPDESYGWAKLVGEVIAQRVRRAGVPVSIVRPFSSYDYDQDDDYPFPQFVRRAARRDDPFVVWSDGGQVRDFIHVSDVVEAITVMVEEGIDGPVNLGTGVGTSMDGLARLCMVVAGYEAPIAHQLDRPVGVRYRVADNSRLLEFYTPKVPLRAGVERALHSVAACPT